MMTRSDRWTRRQFSQALAVSTAGSMVARRAWGLSSGNHRGLAFIGSSAGNGVDGAIHVFRVNGSRWSFAGAVDAAAPVHLAAHPTLPVLYGVHDVSLWGDRPRGAVSAYRFDPQTGEIARLATQPLSLAATHPRHATVTADGMGLFVSAERGGIYNLLPLGTDGNLYPVTAIRKEVGVQDGARARVAAPGQAVLHPDGSLLAVDFGQETISRFRVQRDAIVLHDRMRVHAGQGPSQVAVSHCGRWAYALNQVSGAVSAHSLTREGVSKSIQVHAGAGEEATMRIHPSGSSLIVAGKESLAVLQIDEHTGRLSMQREVARQGLRSIQFMPDGARLIGLEPTSGQLVSSSFDSASGRIGAAETVACVDGCSSLFLYSA